MAQEVSARPVDAQVEAQAPLAPGASEEETYREIAERYWQELEAAFPPEYSPQDRHLIRRAFEKARDAHAGQKRASGEPYISHCVAVARILLEEFRVPPHVVAAGLLHDILEDTPTSAETLRKEFGDEVARLVEGVTKLKALPRVSKHLYEDRDGQGKTRAQLRRQEISSENLRRIFLAMMDNIWVLPIKLADRLHNMYTLQYLPEAKRKRIAQETLDIYAPLANRLGMARIRRKLEDLAFYYVNPEKYQEIANWLQKHNSEREREIQQIVEEVKAALAKAGIKAEVYGRPKHIYSIYRKTLRKHRTLAEIYDTRGIRVLVEDEATCYTVLGVVHKLGQPIPGEFDDYIARPKPNGYQSLHTTILYEKDHKPLEIQIRTYEMHKVAEEGMAAHWAYKEDLTADEALQRKIAWFRSLMEWSQDVTNASDFVDDIKQELFEDRVYVFTPKGDVIDLPKGATPIDFAYAIHTELGHRCRGARVNGRYVPLNYQLKTGDIVEIIAGKRGGPSRDWLNEELGLVKTPRARAKIRRWFRQQEKEENLRRGKQILLRELRRLGYTEAVLLQTPEERRKSATKAGSKGSEERKSTEGNTPLALQDDRKDATPLAQLGFDSLEDLYIAVGRGDVKLERILNVLNELEDRTLHLETGRRKAPVHPEQPPVVAGVSGLLVRLAKCCNPVQGDEVLGYITRNQGITIHRKDCPNFLALQMKHPERIVEVEWTPSGQTFPVPIYIRAFDRKRLLHDISDIIAKENVNIRKAYVDTEDDMIAHIYMVLDVTDLKQLHRVLVRIENLSNVTLARRTGWDFPTGGKPAR